MWWRAARKERERRAIDVAREVVQRVAPDEMPLFEETARAWRRTHARRRVRASATDDLLGFGVTDLEPLLTTATLAAAYAAASFIARTAVDAARDETTTEIRSRTRRLVRALFRRRAAASSPAPEPLQAPSDAAAHLDPEDLRRLRDVTRSVLESTGLSSQQSALVADAVVGAFVTGAGR